MAGYELSTSWRHHNGLGTKKTNLHIMTSANLWKIECIFINIDCFSPNFWYVVFEPIFYTKGAIDFSFQQWHHGPFCRVKRHANFARILYGRWIFLESSFYIPVLFEQYLDSFMPASIWESNFPFTCYVYVDFGGIFVMAFASHPGDHLS